MGVVYRARHAASERAVALKTVKVPATRWLESIRREIQALTRIRHPGVVRIVDHGVHQGRPWYAMDLLEGESLAHFGERVWSPYRRPSSPPIPPTDRVGTSRATSTVQSMVGSGPLSEAAPDHATRSTMVARAAAGELTTVLQIMRRICASLAFLHGEGFVNCDLKPENVLLVEGQPVIIDFGLTAHHPGGSGREALETQRAMSGTLPYMSPEQIRGEFLDARSDLYAVGCMLYELVVGHVPFGGAPLSIKTAHLSTTPVPPSELVADVPPELERVILKLLEKDLDKRFGYADEVAALLAAMSNDVPRLREFPPPRSYLYRPRFVGRDALVSQLAALRDRAIEGCGALVLLAGESGVGKTRVAMEVTRVLPSSRMQIVTSEASSLSTESAGAVGSSPLHALRPLLQSVADCCQEGGAAVTERLLGHRRSVLAVYEPLLAHVPAADGLTPPMPLSVEASRQRLFKYLSEVLRSFAEDRPLLWVIDDLSWADELSLAFLQSLTNEYLETTPLFVVCTYRSEESTEAVAAIARLPHVTHVTLPPLGPEAVSSMIEDMLALRDAKNGFAGFVSQQAEGNPFFVAEYLRTAVTERVLYRDAEQAWKMVGRGQEGRQFDSLQLPVSLRELIDQRLTRLTPAAQQAGLAAAVLGREADVEVLQRVASLSDDAASTAVDELFRRHVLQPGEQGRVRFAHDKLREVVYGRAAAERLVDLHGRAADVLEEQLGQGEDANRHWAVLGHHFGAAKRAEPAARYLKLAADHARATYANGDAIRLYREAIKQVHAMLAGRPGEALDKEQQLTHFHEALGDILALTGQREAARGAYDEALGRSQEQVSEQRARLHRKIGKTWETDHRDDEALRFYHLALAALAPDPLALGQEGEYGDEWIQIHMDLVWVYYWLDRVSEMDATIRTIRPIIEHHGSLPQRVRFFHGSTQLSLRRDRYVVTEETLAFARKAVEACADGAGVTELPMAQFSYGFSLLFHGAPEEAMAQLQAALVLAERVGDVAQQARCLTYLAVATRMQKRIGDTRAYTERSARAAAAAGMREYVAAARANQAWLALQGDDLDTCAHHAESALKTWRALTTLVFPFQWLALLPLLRAALSRGNIERAASYTESLLLPSQQYLPGPAVDALVCASNSWTMKDDGATRAALELALRHLDQTAYC